MNVDAWKAVAEIASSSVTALAVIVGGGWVLWKYVLQREAHAKIEFDLDLRILGTQGRSLLVEVVAIVTNRGTVRHWLRDLRFDLLSLDDGAPVTFGDERINQQVLFRPVIKKRYWIPPGWAGTFIDAGVTQRYTHVTAAPDSARFLLVFAQFLYPDAASEFHTAQRAFAIDGDVPPRGVPCHGDAG